MSAPTPLLEVRSLEVAYGGIHAVKRIDMSGATGERVCLLGANGAGKTTMVKGICGLQPVHGGSVRVGGEDTTGRHSFRLVRKGIAMVAEGRGVFGALTIAENLAMGAYTRHDRRGVASDIDRVYALFPRLEERRRQTAGTLSGGEQQMLAIGRALMARPRLLLLDEPSLGLAPLIVQEIFRTLAALKGEGVTLLLVEQNAKMALS